MTKKQLLLDLIKRETDPEKLAKYQDELVAAISEEAKAEAHAEIEAKRAADQAIEAKAKAGQSATGLVVSGSPKIEVLATDNYKGFNLRKSYGWLTSPQRMAKKPGMTAIMKERPDQAMGVIKLFADLIDNAYKNPMAQMVARAAMQEGTTTEGGFLTPTEERMEILSYVRESSVALRDCQLINMTSDVMTLPAENAKVSVAYTAEEVEATESEPTIAQVTLTAKRMDAYSISSNELLQDAANPGGIAGMLLDQFVEAVGQKVDSTVFQCGGDPVSSIFSAAAGVSEVFSSGSTHFSELLEANIRQLIGKIPTSRLAGAKWYGHRTVIWNYAYGLKDTTGRPLFVESLVQSAPHRLWGYPVEMPEQTVSTSAATTGLLAFGNLMGFLIGERLSSINLFIDPYSRSTYYQTLFLMFTRWAYAHGLNGMYGRIATA